MNRTIFFAIRQTKCVYEGNMKTSITSWGPCGWTFLHTVTFVYPQHPNQTDKTKIIDFLYSFADVIPCFRCRTDFKYMLHTTFGEDRRTAIQSQHLKDRETLTRVIIDIHNEVNKKLHKNQLSYDQVVAMYTTESRKYNIVIVTLVVLVILLINLVLLFRQTRRWKRV